jgi:predicted double-glycine peptidase
MWALVAALSSLTLAVPYLPQTEAMCGGAAAAMVFRYWGDAHADFEPFAPLVDKRAGGIEAGALVTAIEARGWQVFRFAGSPGSLAEQVEQGRPVIILVADKPRSNHFVVVTGVDGDAVIVHDPTWGPSRRWPVADLMRVWRPTGLWSLVILPRDDLAQRASAAEDADAADAPTRQPTHCDRLLDAAIGDSAARSPADAYAQIARVRDECPGAAGPLRELAAVRFSEQHWRDAADLAASAAARDPDDEYSWDLLGSSRFMLDDIAGSLRAWNRIGKPRVNLMEIDGLSRSRYETIASTLGIRPNMLLTENAYRLAARRLDDLPGRAAAGLSLRPEADGFVTVKAALVERTAPTSPLEWTAAAVQAGVDREARVTIAGRSGQGEAWTMGWRWWQHRPRVGLEFAAPIRGSVVTVAGQWESQEYEGSLEESRAHAALSLARWLTPDVRIDVTGGLDSWNGSRSDRTLFAGGSLERRWRQDQWSVGLTATAWMPFGTAAPFQSSTLRGSFRSTRLADGWVVLADAGVSRASSAAPLLLWPRAGEGRDTDALLRAHPLFRDGIVAWDERSVFGRTLGFAHAEAQRWMTTASPVRLAVAAFADAANASRRMSAADTTQIDVGGGLRLRIPGTAGTLRVDVAHGLRDDADALTLGWLF